MYLPAPTLKNTKTELLAAFEELRQKYEANQGQQVLPTAARRQEEDMLLEKTAAYTPPTIEADIAALRQKLQEYLDRVGRELTDESKKLAELREALTIEANRLKETRHIELAAQALDMLMTDYSHTEQELAAKREKSEQELVAAMTQKKREWEREQEEYSYNLKISRRKEQDAYDAECAKKDAQREEKFAVRTKELAESETTLQARTEEVARLEKAVTEHPAQLEQAVREAEQRTSEVLRKDFATEKRLLEQEWKAEKNMLEAKLQSLQELLKNQTAEIISLKTALTGANQQAQSLAATVIESVSGAKQMKIGETSKE